MKFVLSQYFLGKIKYLKKHFPKIEADFKDFETNFLLEEWKHLWKSIYKFRMKNSSIPTGKSGWFRIIIYALIQEEKVFPIIIYSKTHQENITFEEILESLKKTLL